jgi:hypothetical protein
MDSITKKLIETINEITTLGNVNPKTGKAEPGMHEYDNQGNKIKTWSSGSTTPNSSLSPSSINLSKSTPKTTDTPDTDSQQIKFDYFSSTHYDDNGQPTTTTNAPSREEYKKSLHKWLADGMNDSPPDPTSPVSYNGTFYKGR